MIFSLLACAPPAAEGLGEPCVESAESRTCPHASTKLKTGWTGLDAREVHWQVPEGSPPPAGWPAAILFQGSFYSAETFWSAEPEDAHGRWNQVGLVIALLDAGIAVVTPETRFGGRSYWDTNVPPFAQLWSTAPDHALMLDLFAAIDYGAFGALDVDTLFAAGISSGGYMTSRMAVSYPGQFRALAIQSGSYATCSGALCAVPADLPGEHPPTLFLVGQQDAVVPPATTEAYFDALGAMGVDVDLQSDPEVGHAWLDVAPDAITSWFVDGP